MPEFGNFFTKKDATMWTWVCRGLAVCNFIFSIGQNHGHGPAFLVGALAGVAVVWAVIWWVGALIGEKLDERRKKPKEQPQSE